MSALGPRLLEPDAWTRWLTEACALLWRRPGVTLAYTAVITAVHWVGHLAAWAPVRALLALLVAVMGLVVFLRLALALDYNRSVHPAFAMPANLDTAVAVTVAAALFAIHGALTPAIFAPLAGSLEEIVLGLGIYEERLETGAPAPPPLAHALLGPLFLLGGTLGAACVGAVLGLLATGQWFSLSMVVLHAAPPLEAARTSARAYAVNPTCMMAMAGPCMAAVALLVVSAGWLGPLLVPLLGALLYTSYRDVFLGRSTNHPAGVPVPTDAELAQGAAPVDEEPFPGRPGPDR